MKVSDKYGRPVSFRLKSQLLKAIDAVAKRENRSRANMVQELLSRAVAQDYDGVRRSPLAAK